MGCQAFNSHRKIKEQSTSVEDNDNDDKIDKVLDPILNLDIEEYSTHERFHPQKKCKIVKNVRKKRMNSLMFLVSGEPKRNLKMLIYNF